MFNPKKIRIKGTQARRKMIPDLKDLVNSKNTKANGINKKQLSSTLPAIETRRPDRATLYSLLFSYFNKK
jgi:hypothetical protein